MKILSLCSGIGGLDHQALQLLGLCDRYEVTDCVEIRSYRQDILTSHNKGVKIHGDLKEFNERLESGEIEGVWDIVVGGSPCDGNSAANTGGEGLQGESSGLWFDMLRTIKLVKPRVVLWENPAGARSPKGGDRFSPLGIVIGGLIALGYGCQSESFTASESGGPHTRERILLIAYANGWKPEKRSDIPPSWNLKIRSDVEKSRDHTRWPCHAPRDSGVHNGFPQVLHDRAEGWWKANKFIGKISAPARSIPDRYERLSALGDSCCPITASFAWKQIDRYHKNHLGIDEKISVEPYIKWIGGKRRVISELINRMPGRYRRYFEPFVGAGALFFHTRPRDAYLSDLNPELINTYLMVRDRPRELIEELEKHRQQHSTDYYYEVRLRDRIDYEYKSLVERAARFIYLVQAGYNGMWRENSKGENNVPIGRYKEPKIYDVDQIYAACRALQGVQIECHGFQEIENLVKEGDFVYIDPPYVDGFTEYTAEGFDYKKQVELKGFCDRLTEKAAYVMISNSSNPKIYDLYPQKEKGRNMETGEYQIEEVYVGRSINCVKGMRGKVPELILRNYGENS
ncbi:MAG: Dam family site-specific DNA-(adenine-N6)-methyltransferase [Moorea sp. SIO4A3]|nr:Dam family site-specific DNA-(adenine-N6)-methyltransferase [Moorena sp. SIO4A3]